MKTDKDLREILSKAIKEAGGVRKWAFANGVSPSAISRVMIDKHKPFMPTIAKALGYQRTTRVWVSTK